MGAGYWCKGGKYKREGLGQTGVPRGERVRDRESKGRELAEGKQNGWESRSPALSALQQFFFLGSLIQFPCRVSL